MDVHTRNWWRLPIINRRSWTWRDTDGVATSKEWYQNAVIYQIAPWSYKDSDGDGTGDLQGIIDRIDYIGSLGVDAVWLTPIYPSPMDDFGYDVSGLREVGETFGSMDDFRRLLALLHQRGMKLILDMVWNHTSDHHPWFRDSAASRTGPRAGWYVWADPAADGGPPNNWMSVLTGASGWIYHEGRGQYYFTNFLESQPELNWHHPALRDEVLRIARFWLDEGIDGMRLDAVNFFCHDPRLRSNPPRPATARRPDGIDADNPAAAQMLQYSFCRPDTFECLRPIRALVDTYPGVVLLGEVTLCEDSIAEAASYTHGHHRLHLAYHSALLFKERMTAERMRAIIEHAIAAYGPHGACWMAGNHDYGRMRSLWASHTLRDRDQFARMMAALLIALPGALCLWQGDELGLDEARIPEDIPPERIRDPFGKRMYPRLPGRDGSRTPMPWDDTAPAFGFTSAREPWLPIPASHAARAVTRQTADPESLLNTWRTLLHWHVAQPALEAGTVALAPLPPPLLGIIRQHDEQRLLCLFNMSEDPVDADIACLGGAAPARGLGFTSTWHPEGRLHLPGWGVFFADLHSPRPSHGPQTAR